MKTCNRINNLFISLFSCVDFSYSPERMEKTTAPIL
jgi:hypothetical protein